MNHYVYIVQCGDGTYYTGYTNDLCGRCIQHMKGKGAKYTRGRGPIHLVYSEECENKSCALKREYKIKQMSRKDKIKLIRTIWIQYYDIEAQ